MSAGQSHPLLVCLRKTLGAAHQTDAQLLAAFRTHGDQGAFRALVARHGPLVLSACRGVLRDEADVEDAFQATFLVLLRKRDTVREGQALGGWLFRVARRVALEARAAATRRRQCEGRAAVAPDAPTAPPDPSWREACVALHEEVDRLPDRFRLPLVLCYLQGLSRDEAARRLGWSAGSVKGRLERGREVLRDRLVRRGFGLSAGLLAVLENSPAVGSVLPPRLVEVTLRAAAAGGTESVAVLVAGGIQTMTANKIKLAAVVLLAAGLVAGGFARAQRGTAGDEAAKPPAAAGAKPQAGDDKADVYSGRVVGPDGNPVAGARLFLALPWGYLARVPPSGQLATSDADGGFRVTVPKGKYGHRMAVVATADGYGPSWTEPRYGEKSEGLTLKMVKDDVSVIGRVVNLQGRPVAGATVRLAELRAPAGDDLAAWVEGVKARRDDRHRLMRALLPKMMYAEEVPGLAIRATTDADGRFRLTGIGRERVALAYVEGPTVATQEVLLMTRAAAGLAVAEAKGDRGLPDLACYAPGFTHAAAPTKVITGVVRDKDTKKPLAGVRVASHKMADNPLHGRDFVRTTTDAEGRYRLVGMPKGEGNKIMLVPPDGAPYLVTGATAPDTPGLDPVAVDFDLKRGVWVTGRVTDKATGKPVSGRVEYRALADNPNLKDYPSLESLMHRPLPREWAAADGTFRVVGLPGPGVLAVQASDHYLLAHQRDDADGTKDVTLNTRPFALFAVSYNAVARFDPPQGSEEFQRDVTLDPGMTVKGTVLGPDGQPLTGWRAYGLTGWGPWDRPARAESSFVIRGFNPRRPRNIYFQHAEKGLVGMFTPPEPASIEVTVTLRPGVTVLGRLVDGDGRPRAGVELGVSFRPPKAEAWAEFYPAKVTTDADGRFRLTALLPGVAYQFRDGDRWASFDAPAGSGAAKDLGDVRVAGNGE